MSYEMIQLNQVCHFITDGTHQTPTYSDSGITFLSSKNVTTGKIDWENTKYISEDFHDTLKRNFTPQIGDVLLAKNGTTGIAAIVDKAAIFSIYVSLAILRPQIDLILPEYLLKVVNSPLAKRQFNSHLKGIGVPNLHLKDIRSCKIPLPPLPIQKKIVRVLDKAQQLIDLREKQIQLLDELVKSVFYDMFGDPVKNEKGWEIEVLRNHCTKIGSGATPKGGKSSYKDSGISLIRSLNVHNNLFKMKDLAFIDDIQASKLNNVIIEKNDVLLNITGASVARSSLVPDDILPARVNQHVSIIRPSIKSLNPVFLNRMFTYPVFQQLLLKIGGAGGATREAITKDQIENLDIILPPIALQNEFADKVQKIEAQKELMQQSLSEMKNNYNSLMQRAFKGELFKEEALV